MKKRSYCKPVIEEYNLDKTISVIMSSGPPDDPGGFDTPPIVQRREERHFDTPGFSITQENAFGGSKPKY